jgi:RNA 2',3'-cyclic 3'-phosphodiesterase
VALDLSESSRAVLTQWRDKVLEGREELRPVSVQAMHLTLVFLGYQLEADIERIIALAVKSVEEPNAVRLSPRQVLGVPKRDPRLFALDLADQAGLAQDLHHKTSQALTDGGFYRPEKRPFWPHITLARIRRGLASDFATNSLPPDLTADELTLYRSHLRPEGAHYEALTSVCLRS